MTTLQTLVNLVGAGGVQRVYKINGVPKDPGTTYAVVGLGSPDKVSRTTDGKATDLNRATVQFFSTTNDGVLDIATKGDLDGRQLNQPDGPLIIRELSTPPYRDPDNQGVLSVLHTYRF